MLRWLVVPLPLNCTGSQSTRTTSLGRACRSRPVPVTPSVLPAAVPSSPVVFQHCLAREIAESPTRRLRLQLLLSFPSRPPPPPRLPRPIRPGPVGSRPFFFAYACGRRLGGRTCPFAPTASHATPANPAHALPSSPAPPFPVADTPTTATAAQSEAFSPPPRTAVSSRLPSDRNNEPPAGVAAALRALEAGRPPSAAPPTASVSRQTPPSARPLPPFRTDPTPFPARTSNPFQRPLRRLSAARLWNPTNSTPRGVVSSSSRRAAAAAPKPSATPSRRRAPSSPTPAAVPLSHPALHSAKPVSSDDPIGTGAGDYPLLTLPEQRQIRHSTSPRASLQVERAGSEKRVSLPKSVRHSYDGKRLTGGSATAPVDELAGTVDPDIDTSVAGPSVQPPTQQPATRTRRKRGQSVSREDGGDSAAQRPATATTVSRPFGLVLSGATRPSQQQDYKGKGKSIMAPSAAMDETTGAASSAAAAARRSYSKDLERGPDILGSHNRNSTASMPDGLGIGSAISSSNSSIMGDPDTAAPELGGGEEWGPQHPCFPHRNPHVSVDDPAYVSTRIIRVRRDWLVMGDLAPTFSNLYPEILDPAGLSEHEFRRVVDKLNRELIAAFSPWSVRSVLDSVLGLATGWLWEDLGLTGAKARLARLERWIQDWNDEMARTADDSNPVPPKLISLRQTGYMTLDIQIGDPEIAAVPPSTPAASRTDEPFDMAGAGA